MNACGGAPGLELCLTVELGLSGNRKRVADGKEGECSEYAQKGWKVKRVQLLTS